jgi:hypothetical protein
MKHRTLAALSLGAVWLLAACAAGPAPPPVPPLMTEEPPKPPVTVTPLILQPGHWDWSGSGYVWQPGQYVPNEGHSNLWLPGYWALGNGGWVWQPAHWQ